MVVLVSIESACSNRFDSNSSLNPNNGNMNSGRASFETIAQIQPLASHEYIESIRIS